MTPTRFGSLASFDKGRVEPISDDPRHYAFSNCFDVAARSAPHERVVFAQNQGYALEVARAEGESPWYTCAHDEFALCMDGEVEVHLVQIGPAQQVPDPAHAGAVLVEGTPQGARMGSMRLRRGHQAMLPANAAYQFRARQPGVLVIQTCKGLLSREKWADICQLA
jgi:hypothetical protein